MRKLLRANFARLWKDKVFWGALVVLACYGCWAVSASIGWWRKAMM